MRSPRIDRRSLLAGSAAFALSPTACSKKPARVEQVSVVKAPSYSVDLFSTIRRILLDHKLNVRGRNVVLKPNLVEFDSATCINTHPLVVAAAHDAFRSLGANVSIAEGPGHRRITLDLADAAGFFTAVPQFERSFTDLNLDEVSEVAIPNPVSRLKSIYLPNTIRRCDLLVSLPKMKTHHWVGATLSMKNFFGLVPGSVYGWPKNVLHWAGIPECIADLQKVVPPTFAIVDGIVGMEGNGPIQGTPKTAGVLVAGASLPAVDRVCCRIMGIDWRKVPYMPLIPGATSLRVEDLGDRPETVATPFALIPEFRNLRLT